MSFPSSVERRSSVLLGADRIFTDIAATSQESQT